jgi:signal peptidase I
MAGLYLAGILIAPVAGVAMALVFAALGWGILRRERWAATAAAVGFLAPILLLMWNGGSWLTIAVEIGIAFVPVWAAATLWRHREIARTNAGWLAFALCLTAAAMFVRPYAAPSASMANTIKAGDYILTERLSWTLGRSPHFGDVISFRYPIDPKEVYLKRVVGLPGDRIRLVNKQLYRNGAPVSEPYAIHSSSFVDAYRDNFPAAPNYPLKTPAMDMLQNHVSNGEVVVPPGKYFVLGDNRDDSADSRYWGFVSRAEILASPLVIYASYDVPAQSPGATGTIFNTRWNRLLKRL